MPAETPAQPPRQQLGRMGKTDLWHLRDIVERRIREDSDGTAATSPLTCAEVLILIEQAAMVLPPFGAGTLRAADAAPTPTTSFEQWHDAKYPKPRAIDGTVAWMTWSERRAYRQTGWEAAITVIAGGGGGGRGEGR